MHRPASERVVITGFGIVSPLGNRADDVSRALREGRSGIRAMPEYAKIGMRSQVAGVCDIDLEARIDRKQKRFMGDELAPSLKAFRHSSSVIEILGEGIWLCSLSS